MSKKVIVIIGIIALLAAVAMKYMGRSSHLTELQEYWWAPLPVTLICMIVVARKSS